MPWVRERVWRLNFRFVSFRFALFCFVFCYFFLCASIDLLIFLDLPRSSSISLELHVVVRADPHRDLRIDIHIDLFINLFLDICI